jgi:hypothetical protein
MGNANGQVGQGPPKVIESKANAAGFAGSWYELAGRVWMAGKAPIVHFNLAVYDHVGR